MSRVKSTHVFVSLYIMLGDCDGSIQGTKVFKRPVWEKEIKILKDHLKKIDQKEIQVVDYKTDMSGHARIDSYTVYSCSLEEYEVLKKFDLDNTHTFLNPSDLVEQNSP